MSNSDPDIDAETIAQVYRIAQMAVGQFAFELSLSLEQFGDDPVVMKLRASINLLLQKMFFNPSAIRGYTIDEHYLRTPRG
jgi:hypothetical protein